MTDDHITQEVSGPNLTWACTICGDMRTAPNKGFGRSILYAWSTRHQHEVDR